MENVWRKNNILIRRVLTLRQLEKRFYNRQEIAEILSEKIEGNKHFKRNVEDKLKKWGYEYTYSIKGVQILKVPETAEEKLAELMLKEYKLDVQIDLKDFAYFLYAFQEIDGFEAMPWKEREAALIEFYGIIVNERTLRNWSSKLIKTGTMAKCKEAKVYWRTSKILGETKRELVSGDEELEKEMRQYWNYRRQLLEQKLKWDEVNKELWNFFGCCYYSCSFIAISAFDSVGLFQEIFDLVEEVIKNDRNKVKEVPEQQFPTNFKF